MHEAHMTLKQGEFVQAENSFLKFTRNHIKVQRPALGTILVQFWPYMYLCHATLHSRERTLSWAWERRIPWQREGQNLIRYNMMETTGNHVWALLTVLHCKTPVSDMFMTSIKHHQDRELCICTMTYFIKRELTRFCLFHIWWRNGKVEALWFQ